LIDGWHRYKSNKITTLITQSRIRLSGGENRITAQICAFDLTSGKSAPKEYERPKNAQAKASLISRTREYKLAMTASQQLVIKSLSTQKLAGRALPINKWQWPSFLLIPLSIIGISMASAINATLYLQLTLL
jgi:hypothetical protein